MQFFLADRTGASAVVDGEDVHWMGGHYMLTTDFRLRAPSLGGWPCFLYARAHEMLEGNSSASVDRAAEILDATQFPCSRGYASCARYSVICDLADAQAILYFSGDFTRSVELDIDRLCTDGLVRVPIESLFEESAS